MKVKSITRTKNHEGDIRLALKLEGHKSSRIVEYGALVTLQLNSDASPNPVSFVGTISSFNFRGTEDEGSATFYAKFEMNFKKEAPEVTMSFDDMKRLVEGTLGKKVKVTGLPISLDLETHQTDLPLFYGSGRIRG